MLHSNVGYLKKEGDPDDVYVDVGVVDLVDDFDVVVEVDVGDDMDAGIDVNIDVEEN